MTYYLGRAGALVALPDPEAGLPVSYERVGGTHQLLSGSRVRDTLGRMRTWNLSWTAIDLITYGTIEGAFLSTFGSGPYYFLDPEQRNMLPANVASGGDALGTTSGFSFGANVVGTISTSFNSTPGGSVAVSLQEATTVVSGQDVLVLDSLPVVPNVSYAFAATIGLNSNTPGHFTQIVWYTAAGVVISSSTGSTIASGATGRSSIVATAPSNAAYAGPHIRVSANNTAGVAVFASIDGFQFEAGSAATSWVPGAGTPLVTAENLSRSTPLSGICDAQMTLVQVG